MKKISNNEPMILSPVKMYWDDLKEIHDRMETGRELQVKSGEYSYSSLEELKEKTKKNHINEIEFTARSEHFNNRISVDIEPGRIWIYQDSESTETAAKVKELLTKNSPWYMYSPDSPAWHMLTGAIGWIPLIIFFTLSSNVESVYLRLVMPFIGVGIILWTFKNSPILGRSKIFISLRKDKLTFWERNKEQFLRDLIIALISGFIFFLLGYLLPK